MITGVTTSAATVGAVPGAATLAATTAAPQVSFGRLLAEHIQTVNDQQLASDRQVQLLMEGNFDHVHDVILSVAKAELGFRFLIELRNRLTESYQELMRMQV